MQLIWISDREAPPADLIADTVLDCVAFRSSQEAAVYLNQNSSCQSGTVGIVWLPLTSQTAASALAQLHRIVPHMPVLFLHPGGEAREAVDLIKAGAYDYYDRVPTRAEFLNLLQRVQNLAGTQGTVEEASWRSLLIGNCPAMEPVLRSIRLIAPRRSTVLLLGATGTGKEVVARAIHQASPRAHRLMVAINCPAIPANLLESELFGHVKGAFTGAAQSRVGLFEQAQGGTLFIDEIGDLPLDLQAKLLRVLQEREIQRIGSSETVSVDVRLIAATNVNLAEYVKQGKFREDLYYRLNVVPIHLPTLAERVRDIPALAQHFVRKVCLQENLPFKFLSHDALELLESYPWPGNVRQLENAVEMAVVLAAPKTVLRAKDFSLPEVSRKRPVRLGEEHVLPLPEQGLDFEQVISQIEQNLLAQALERSQGNKQAAASILGLKRTTLMAKLKSFEALAQA